ncbi:CXXC-type zinc finger protein 1 [Orchesella cincta]|uniref:CXXC-type zinc finger protein 1 n=1 Tax=Orchesella cincta TaxID=48709 RepID=A0A1D2NA81_ORCCI|nr:CXXC-type zinc finger protein 1 [Orchesella cincta]
MGRSKIRGKHGSRKKSSTRRDATTDSEDSDWMDEQEGSKRSNKRSRDPATVTRKGARKQRGKDRSEEEEKKDDLESSKEPRQCYWIECVNVARPNSKYCSDDCGIKLAKKRILTILPAKLEQWKKSPCFAEDKNKLDLENASRERTQQNALLEDLEHKRIALDSFIDKVSKLEYKEDALVGLDLQEEEGSVACVSCGLECSRKNFLKHIEKCYNKHEKNMTFVSSEMTVVNGTPIHCDFLNVKTNRYCKRLKELCPEHTKPPKHPPNAICGAPMSSDPYELDIKTICLLQKKECTRHHCWEKLRRVEIDMRKVYAWMKIQGTRDQEHKSNEALASRCNVLGLLLHTTTSHDYQNQEKAHKVREDEVKDRERELASSTDQATVSNNDIPTEKLEHDQNGASEYLQD